MPRPRLLWLWALIGVSLSIYWLLILTSWSTQTNQRSHESERSRRLSVNSNSKPRQVEQLQSQSTDEYFRAHANRQKVDESLVLFSKCYCQRELVYVNKKDAWSGQVEIVIRDQNENLIGSYSMNESDVSSLSCDLYRSLRRGPRQRVIGVIYSATNQIDLRSMLESASRLFPGWIVRVYYERQDVADPGVVCVQECRRETNNVDFCDVNELPLNFESKWNAAKRLMKTSWRWLPLGDRLVDVFLSRDLNACFSQREISAINEWLGETNKTVHIMKGL